MNQPNFTKSLPNHQYYTLNFRNNGVNGEAEDASVDYLEVRNQPYLLEPDLYSCSIIRFGLTTATLPIFIPQMSNDFQTTNPALDTYQKTVYSVTMQYGNGTAVRKYVKYLPQTYLNPQQTLNFPAPPDTDVNAAARSPYFYIYQAAQFVVMVNNALAACIKDVLPGCATPVYIDWIDKESQAIFYAPKFLCQEPGYASQPTTYGTAQAAIAGPGTVGTISGAGTVASPWEATVTVASTAGIVIGSSLTATNGAPGSLYGGTPTLVYVTAVVTNTSFTYQVAGGTTPVAGTVTNIIPSNPLQLKVWFNSPLFNLFSSFQAVKIPYTFAQLAGLNGQHFRYQWWNLYNSTEQAAETFVPPDLLNKNPASTEYLAINQSYSTVPLWNPCKSIVFTTALLPILPENVSAPQTIGATTRFASDGNNANLQNILTDFEVELVNGEETRPTVYYTPTAEYRMIDLQGNQPLTGIQLRVFWRNKFGDLIPLELGTDGNAQIKILFRRRDWQS